MQSGGIFLYAPCREGIMQPKRFVVFKVLRLEIIELSETMDLACRTCGKLDVCCSPQMFHGRWISASIILERKPHAMFAATRSRLNLFRPIGLFPQKPIGLNAL